MLNTLYPIIQAPMAGGIVTPQFVAQVSNSGCLGFVAGGYLSPDDLEDFIRETKRLTNKTFGVNIFIDQELNRSHYYKPKTVIDMEKSLGINISHEVSLPAIYPESDYIKVILKNEIKLVSCTFGVFNRESLTKLHDNKVKVLATATNMSEVEYSLAKDVDGIILQGTEAGGHQGTFLSESINTTTTMDLLNQAVLRHPDKLLIAAGGINSLNFTQFLAAGANYVQIGSEFLLTDESGALPCYKQYILSHPETQLSRGITGKFARGVANKLMLEMEKSAQILDFPLQHYATAGIRKYSRENSNPEYLSLWAGENIRYCTMQPLGDLLDKLISEYEGCDLFKRRC